MFLPSSPKAPLAEAQSIDRGQVQVTVPKPDGSSSPLAIPALLLGWILLWFHLSLKVSLSQATPHSPKAKQHLAEAPDCLVWQAQPVLPCKWVYIKWIGRTFQKVCSAHVRSRGGGTGSLPVLNQYLSNSEPCKERGCLLWLSRTYDHVWPHGNWWKHGIILALGWTRSFGITGESALLYRAATRMLTMGAVIGFQAQRPFREQIAPRGPMRRPEWVVCEHMWTPQGLPEMCEQDQGQGWE